MSEFPISDEINALGVSKIVTTNDYLYVYNGSNVIQSKFYKKELQKTLLELQDKMISSGHFGDQNKVQKIIFHLSNVYVDAEVKKAKENEGKKRYFYSQIYKSPSVVAEAIFVGNYPKWLVSRASGSISIEDNIEFTDKKVMKPFKMFSYVNRPYIFQTLEEVEKAITATRRETFDSLYAKVKKIWKKYIAEDDTHISLCAADCIFTYFQDKLGLTHYLFFVGDNDSGKSNNLNVIHFVGYRNMLSSDMTAANIYSFLGTEYEGFGTICEDEADDIDENREKMKIYKNGYTMGIKVHRLDISETKGRRQNSYNTFCFKAFAAEKRPDSLRAKGFNMRTVELSCTYGIPQYDISEIVNPAGDELDQELLEELNSVRNSLLIFRLLHYYDKIPNLKLNLQNREKQLFKPLLRLFQNTETFEILRPVVGYYVSEKRQARSHTLTAFLCELISHLVKQKGLVLDSTDIWNAYMDSLPGGEKIGRFTYSTEEFGEISQKSLTTMLIDQFHAKRPRHKSNKKQLIFDIGRLDRMRAKYNLDISIKIVDESDESDESLSGLDKHFSNSTSSRDNTSNAKENENTATVLSATNATMDAHHTSKYFPYDRNATQATHPTQDSSAGTITRTTSNLAPIPAQTDTVDHSQEHAKYRRADGNLGCHNCTTFGDIFDMRKQPCKKRESKL